jgi:hypothetical protein
LSIAVAAGIGLVIIGILGILLLTATTRRAGKRNQNRAEDEEGRSPNKEPRPGSYGFRC